MKTTCLINNFNYETFVAEAVHSALNQTVPFDEIIVVDDGSTDRSVQILEQQFANHPRVKLILNPGNQGQLSAFNLGFAACSGDIIFFLDSDDLYQPTYLESALKVYQAHPDCGFLFCLGDRVGVAAPPQLTVNTTEAVTDLGYSAASVAYLRRWVGEATSMLSLHRRVLQKILPVPDLKDWRTRADDCLVYGASLVGAKKFRLNQRLVQYRLHGQNDSFKLSRSPSYKFQFELVSRRFFHLMLQRSGLSLIDLAELVHLEFQTLPKPDWSDLLHYLKVLWMTHLGLYRKLKRSALMLKHFLSSRRTVPESPPLSPIQATPQMTGE